MLLSVDDVREGLERRGLIVRRVGRGYLGQCPAHHDRTPSLSFGPSRRDDGSAFLHCFAGCLVRAIVAALGVNGTAVPLSPEERERRRAEDEAERDARTARARARYELALRHPDRRRALEHFAPALRWDVVDLLERGVTWDGSRIVLPIAGADGALIGIERYAPPGSRARRAGPKTIACGRRSLWPAPEAVAGLRFLVEGSGTAATMLAAGLPTAAYPSASGLRLIDAKRLQAAGAGNLVVLADADAVGRRAARTSCLVLRGAGVHARAVDLFDGADTGVDVADELRSRSDGAEWLQHEIDRLKEEK